MDKEHKYFLSVSMGALLIFSAVAGCSKASVDDCRKVKPNDLKSYIEKDFRSKMESYKESGGKSIGPFISESVKVQTPVLDENKKSGIDWNSTIAMESEANGKMYRVLVYYTCGNGIEYSGVQKMED